MASASANVKDPAGNFWYIATYKGDSYRWEGAPTLQPYLHPLRAEPVLKFMKRAFGAEELGRYTTPDGVIHHTTVKIGNAYMEMGEAHGSVSTHADDVLSVRGRLRRPVQARSGRGCDFNLRAQDHPYGDRSGGVIDPFGNKWYIATHIKDM